MKCKCACGLAQGFLSNASFTKLLYTHNFRIFCLGITELCHFPIFTCINKYTYCHISCDNSEVGLFYSSQSVVHIAYVYSGLARTM